MSLHRTAGALIATCVSATAVLADVRGVRNPPAFTPTEMQLINKDARLIDANRSCPWQLRHALDVWEDMRGATRPAHASAQSVLCTQTPEDSGRASAEAALDLLKILREVAGQSTNR